MIKSIIIELKVFIGLGKWYKIFNSVEAALKTIPDKKSILVEVEGKEICVARNNSDLSAFLNLCPHNQMPLNRGAFNDKKEWICPYHRHCFELQGGKNMSMPSAGKLKLFSLKIIRSGVYVYSPNK